MEMRDAGCTAWMAGAVWFLLPRRGVVVVVEEERWWRWCRWSLRYKAERLA